MLYIIGIIVVVWFLVNAVNKQSAIYEVIDKDKKSRTLGQYNQCVEWIRAQKGMDSLTGQKNRYTIKKKKW